MKTEVPSRHGRRWVYGPLDPGRAQEIKFMLLPEPSKETIEAYDRIDKCYAEWMARRRFGLLSSRDEFMSDTPTPRTDAAKCRMNIQHTELVIDGVHADFARELEREVDEWVQWSYHLGLGLDPFIPWNGVDNRLRIEMAVKEFVQIKKEVTELRRWKTEALAVEASWDQQAVGRALGMTLGTPIRAGILPAVEKLKAELASLRHARTETQGDH
jgi:hypothetical protein